MTAIDDQPQKRRASIVQPMVSALAVIAGAAYAFAYGFAAIPPFVALLLVGAFANVLFRLAEMLRQRSNNIFTAALSAITLMVSILSGVVLIAFAMLAIIFGSKTNVLDDFMRADDVPAKLYFGFVISTYALLALFGLMQVVTLWLIVGTNAFGAPDPSREEI